MFTLTSSKKSTYALIVIISITFLINAYIVAHLDVFSTYQDIFSPQPGFSNSDITVESQKTSADLSVPATFEVYPGGYGLFIKAYYDLSGSEGVPDFTPDISYANEGTVESGEYAGWNRIIGSRTFYEPYGDTPTPYYFISKDFKEFKLVTEGTTTYDAILFNPEKVTGTVQDIAFPHPKVIEFGSFTYNLTQINTRLDASSRELGKTPEGFAIYDNPSDEIRDMKFVQAFTTIKVRDSFGVVADYDLQFKTDRKVDEYERSLISAKDIVTSAKVYEKYGGLLPQACGISTASYVLKGVSDSELKEIGKTKSGITLYVIKDLNHPLYAKGYEVKVMGYDKGKYFSELNDGKKIPTLSEYVARNPIILFRDAFGRLAALGEFEYRLDGGCGKPVIYLYPEKETDITVSFKNKVQLTTQIPTYDGGWSVRADENGNLKDLNPSATDCDDFDDAAHGSDYAYEACRNNSYPYIYWAGNAYVKYPAAKKGFVVKSDELKTTMEKKLRQIGLSAKEIDDMVSYWYPEMIKKNAPFYRITFFQTQDMNSFIPMSVSPKPDTMIRVFLDWQPLSKSESVAPQTLITVPRNGFTYVEWGGLKR